MFIVLFTFSSSLALEQTKCVSLNDDPFTLGPTLIDLNPVKLKYYPFMIILDKCSGSCNVLSPKICVPKETEDRNVKAFNMIINKNEPKSKAKHISCDSKCRFNGATCNSNQKWIHKTDQCEFKNYRKCKKDHSWNHSTCTCEKTKYLKSIADTSIIAYDQQKWQIK